MSRHGPSLAGRAAAALTLTVAFYGLAIVSALALFAVPAMEVMLSDRLHIKLAVACVVGGFAILAAVAPRLDRFDAPGPRLTPEEQPVLFQAIEQVAAAAGQAMPREVYLTSDVNAFVAERGGAMGIGSRRVMGVGLPLLTALNVSQFQSVLAHEFGHFHGGDTALGRWFHATHTAIARTLRTVQDTPLQGPFAWFGTLFLRITKAIARREEYAADAFAARMTGASITISTLRSVHAAASAFDAFWEHDMVPVIRAGFRPGLADGFSRFLGAPGVAQQLGEAVAAAEREHATDPFETHPALPDRVAALQALDLPPRPEYTRSAVSLVYDVAAQEDRLLRHQFGDEVVASLQSIDWAEVGTRVLLPRWQREVQDFTDLLREVTVDQLPALMVADSALQRRIREDAGEPLSEHDLRMVAAYITSSALGQPLASWGWRIDAAPGDTVMLWNDRGQVRPFEEVTAWGEHGHARGSWQRQCQQLGLTGLPVTTWS